MDCFSGCSSLGMIRYQGLHLIPTPCMLTTEVGLIKCEPLDGTHSVHNLFVANQYQDWTTPQHAIGGSITGRKWHNHQ